jgi:hypothetical protein
MAFAHSTNFPILVVVLPDHSHFGSAVLVPGREQLVCPAGVLATIHPAVATSKYLHAIPQAEPAEVKLEEAT